MYCIQHCFVCRPSDSTVSEHAGIEPRIVATTALAVRRSNQSAKSHPCIIVWPPQGVTRRRRLSLLTNSVLVYEPKCGGRGVLRGLSQWKQLCNHVTVKPRYVNFGDLPLYLTYGPPDLGTPRGRAVRSAMISGRRPRSWPTSMNCSERIWTFRTILNSPSCPTDPPAAGPISLRWSESSFSTSEQFKLRIIVLGYRSLSVVGSFLLKLLFHSLGLSAYPCL